MKRRKRRMRRAVKKGMKTALQVIVSSLSLSLLYYKMMHSRHGTPAAEGEDHPTVGQTP